MESIEQVEITMPLSNIRSSRSAEEHVTKNTRLFEYCSLDDVELRLRSRFKKLVCKQIDHLRSLGNLQFFPWKSISLFENKSEAPTTRQTLNGKSLAATETTQKNEIIDRSIKENLKELLGYLDRYKKEVTHIGQKQADCVELDSIITKQLSGLKKALIHVCNEGEAREPGLANHLVNIETLQHVKKWSNCLPKKPKFTDELEQVMSIVSRLDREHLYNVIESYETIPSSKYTEHRGTHSKNPDHGAHSKKSEHGGTPSKNTEHGETHPKYKDHRAHSKNTEHKGTHSNNSDQGTHSKSPEHGRTHLKIPDQGEHSKNSEHGETYSKNPVQGTYSKNSEHEGTPSKNTEHGGTPLKNTEHHGGTHSNNPNQEEHSKNSEHGTHLKNTGHRTKLIDHESHSKNKTADLKPANDHENRITGHKNKFKRYKRNINWNSKYKTGNRWFELGNYQDQSNAKWGYEYPYKEQQNLRKKKTGEQAKKDLRETVIYKGTKEEKQVQNDNGTNSGIHGQYGTEPKTVFKRTRPEHGTRAVDKGKGSKNTEGIPFLIKTERNNENAWPEIKGIPVGEKNKPESELGTLQTGGDKIQSGYTSKTRKAIEKTETKPKPKLGELSIQERVGEEIKSEIQNEEVKNSNINTEKIKSDITSRTNDKTYGTNKKLNATMQERYGKNIELEFQSTANDNALTEKLQPEIIKFTTEDEEGTKRVVNTTVVKNQKKHQKHMNLDGEFQTENTAQTSHVNNENKNTIPNIKICSSKSDTAIVRRRGYKAGNLKQNCKVKTLEQQITSNKRTCNTPDVMSRFRTLIRVILFIFFSYLLLDIFCLDSVSAPVFGEISKYLDLRYVNYKPF